MKWKKTEGAAPLSGRPKGLTGSGSPYSASLRAGIGETEDAGTFELISLESLIRMKLISFRDKDRMHLRDLASVGLPDETWPARFPESLAKRLQVILDDPDG